MADEVRVFPRSSALEAQLAKVKLDLWELRNNPIAFTDSVDFFISTFLPTMFQKRLLDKKKFPHLKEKLTAMQERVNELKAAKMGIDPLSQDTIDKESIPKEEMKGAQAVWHAVEDVLTEAGLNIPIAVTKPRAKMRA